MNQLFIIGNLTRDCEVRHPQDGTPVCGFTVAVNRRKTKANQNPEADFFNVSVWGALGETCAKYLAKGRKVAVWGQISLRTWETETKHGASLEVRADDVEFLPSRDFAPSGGGEIQQAATVGGATQVDEPDDFPF